MKLSVINGNAATTADEADVRYQVSINDVRCKPGAGACGAANAAGGADYSGQVRAQSDLRITDRYNGPSEVGVRDTPFGVTVPCTVSGQHGDRLDLLDRHDRRRGDARRRSRRSGARTGRWARCRCSTAEPTECARRLPTPVHAVQGVFVP